MPHKQLFRIMGYMKRKSLIYFNFITFMIVLLSLNVSDFVFLFSSFFLGEKVTNLNEEGSKFFHPKSQILLGSNLPG